MIDDNSLFIGLMSGTSMDGVDCALVKFDETAHQAHLIATHLETIPKELKNEALSISLGEENVHFTRIAQLDFKFGELFAQSVNNLLRKAKINPAQIKAIGSHGQTIWHHPQKPVPFTIQIGDPNIIAKKTNITTVADFRRGDMALGGQGAPFVPPFHMWLLGNKEPRVILNIGGIANITLLPFHGEPCLGFDTGPGNGLMDAWTFKHLHQPFDNNGTFAKSGAWHAPLLSKMLTDPFFASKAPKSTGKDYFNLHWLEKQLIEFESLAPKDVQATLLELTAITIAEEILKYRQQAEVLVCGGGFHNSVLLATIARHLGKQFQLKSTEEYGVAPDWLEAVCFAWYAKKRINKETVDLTNITGSSRPVILGGIFEP
jgi:anhydro-N-acetylmuramic acid kinase